MDDLDYRQLATILSIFGDSKELSNNNESLDENLNLKDNYVYSNILKYINSIIYKLSNSENYRQLYIDTNWNINTDLMDATYEWLSDVSFNDIVSKYNLYEGNLIKDFIKIYNLSANIVTISKFLNKPKLEIQANKVMDSILKDVVTVESLYVN